MPATKAAQDQWFAHAAGRSMNPDNAFALQCKDVDDDYVDTLWGKNSWIKILKPGNAKDVFANADPKYFTKVKNNPADPNQVPPHGAIINWCGTRAVPEGHTAVVDKADANGLWVIQQDGYLQYPARRVHLPYVLPNGATVIGWLIPKLEPAKKLASDKEIKQAYLDILERVADADGLAHYKRYDIAFVRADLKASAEYKKLQARKAAVAKATADAAAKAAALRAEANRLAEEKAANERAQKFAEEQAKAIQDALDRAKEASATPTVTIPPVPANAYTQETWTAKPDPTAVGQPEQANPLVRFLFDLYMKVFKK